MNLLLTTKCYSNCKFCFVPKEMKKEQTEMSFLQFKKYIDNINKLYKTNKPVIDSATLFALTLLIAESNPKDKDVVMQVVISVLNRQ